MIVDAHPEVQSVHAIIERINPANSPFDVADCGHERVEPVESPEVGGRPARWEDPVGEDAQDAHANLQPPHHRRDRVVLWVGHRVEAGAFVVISRCAPQRQPAAALEDRAPVDAHALELR
eukprot:822406-Prymnesium_polylepis.2